MLAGAAGSPNGNCALYFQKLQPSRSFQLAPSVRRHSSPLLGSGDGRRGRECPFDAAGGYDGVTAGSLAFPGSRDLTFEVDLGGSFNLRNHSLGVFENTITHPNPFSRPAAE